MLDSQQKRKVSQILYHRVTIGILAVVTILIIRSSIMVYQKKIESDNERRISQNYTVSLEKRASDIDTQIATLGTRAGQEAEIRAKFNVAKVDENIVVIVEEDVATTSVSKKRGIWERFLGLFK